MPIEKANPITGHDVTIMPPTSAQPKPFGWIRLFNDSGDAGYIYLDSMSAPKDPHLGGGGEYVVTAMPFESLEALLDILRNERSLQIRYFDPQSPGVASTAFIESMASNTARHGALRTPKDVADQIQTRTTEHT